jgi:GTP-binding protein EngB required for normal cell division
MSDLRKILSSSENESQKLDSMTILITNLVEFFSTFAEDLSDKIDMIDTKLDKLDEKISNIKLTPQTSTLSLPPPPPKTLTKPVIPEKPKPENLRGKIMDELKEQLLRLRKRQEMEDNDN